MKGTTVKATAGLRSSSGTQIKAEAEAKLLSTRTRKEDKDKTPVIKAKAKASVDEFVGLVGADINEPLVEDDSYKPKKSTETKAEASVEITEAKALPVKNEKEKIKEVAEDLKLDKKIQEPLDRTSRALMKMNVGRVKESSDNFLFYIALAVPFVGIPLMAAQNAIYSEDAKDLSFFSKNLKTLRMAIAAIMDMKKAESVADEFIEDKNKTLNEILDADYKNADKLLLEQDAVLAIEEKLSSEKIILKKQLRTSQSIEEMTTVATKIVVIERVSRKIKLTNFDSVNDTSKFKSRISEAREEILTAQRKDDEKGWIGNKGVGKEIADTVIANLISLKRESLAEKFMELKDLKISNGFVRSIKKAARRIKNSLKTVFINLDPKAKAKVESLGKKVGQVIEYDDLARAAHKSSKGITKAIETLRDPENRKELKYDIFNAAALVSDSLEKQADKVLAKEA